MLRVLNKYSFSATITNSKFYYIRFLFFLIIFLILICSIYYAIKVINILHNYVILNLIIKLSVSLIEGICNISIVASSLIISLSNLILFFDHHLKYGSAHGTKAVDW